MTNNPLGQAVISRDDHHMGTVTGVHRDAVSGAVRWAVVDSKDSGGVARVVPFTQASPTTEGFHVPVDAARILTAPRLGDPTRIGPAEERLLTAHYAPTTGGSQAPPATAVEPGEAAPPRSLEDPSASHTVASMVRSEEQLHVQRLEWRPHKRTRVRTVVRSRQVTHVVEERWQELVLEDEPVTVVERLGLTPPDTGDIDLVLHREEVVISTRIVPYERVRISKRLTGAEHVVEDSIRKEQIEVQRGPAAQ